LIAVIFSNQTSIAVETQSWCIDKNSYFKFGPYPYVKDCKEIDGDLIDITETLYNRLTNSSSGWEKMNSNNKYIFEKYYPLETETIKKKNLDRQAEIEKKKLARKTELDKYTNKCADGLFRKGFKKDTPEFNSCLVEQEKLALKEKEKVALAQKQKEEAAQAKENARLAKINNQKSNSNEANSEIAKTCLGFGYKKGTEKYADCMKDLYLQQNAANKSNSNNSSSSYGNSRYADEMLEIERAKAKALEDSARAQRNRNQSDALMDISRSLLNNNRAPATTNQPLNCRSVRVGNTVQTQCY
jgi:hypothetical protein